MRENLQVSGFYSIVEIDRWLLIQWKSSAWGMNSNVIIW